MEISPLEFIGAFFAACLVLASAKFKRDGPRRYSLRTILIVMTVAAIALGVLSFSFKR